MPPLARVVPLVLLLAGCASAPRTPDPHAEARLVGLEAVGALVDVLRSEDVGANRWDRVDLGDNRVLGQRLRDSLAARLRTQGYPLAHVYPPAVGLFQSHHVPLFVVDPVRTPDGERRLPPLEVPHEIADDPALAHVLNEALAGADDPVVVGPPVRTALAVLIARSRRVPLDRRLLVDRELSETRLTLLLIDVATQQVVWNDRLRVPGAGDEVVFPLLDELVARLPARP